MNDIENNRVKAEADLIEQIKARIAFHANEHRQTYEVGKGVMDYLGATYGLTRRIRKTFTLPFATIRVMEKDKDFRRRIKRAATRRPPDAGAFYFTMEREAGL